MQINQINSLSPDFPADLREIHRPPKQLYVLGKFAPQRTHVAIVGTRSMSRYGKQVAFDLAAELARAGLVIVSGLAVGIDTEAHEGALSAGGLTLAVQGRGLADVYPTRNRDLGRRILTSGGAIISEYEPPVPPFKYNFPERNRIVAGLCRGVIIVESGADGGAMLTADIAAKENRVVMAVPGALTSPVSIGPNNLIANGKAQIIRDSTDVLIALGLNEDAIPLVAPIGAQSKHERTIIELLKGGITATEDIINASGYSAADFANIISLMEITGKVRNLGAGHWAART